MYSFFKLTNIKSYLHLQKGLAYKKGIWSCGFCNTVILCYKNFCGNLVPLRCNSFIMFNTQESQCWCLVAVNYNSKKYIIGPRSVIIKKAGTTLLTLLVRYANLQLEISFHSRKGQSKITQFFKTKFAPIFYFAIRAMQQLFDQFCFYHKVGKATSYFGVLEIFDY